VKKTIIILVVVTVALAGLSTIASAGGGNGAPSGPHYNLNLIGVPREKTADMDNNSGHRIFVKLWGKTKIMLCESGVGTDCADVEGYQVLDANGTDGVASFALPDPDPENDGVTVYSVWARALGKPGGKADMNTCAWDPVAGEEVCSVEVLYLERTKGQQKFRDVSKYLLYIYVDLDGSGVKRYPLFDDALEDYFWSYDNQGLKLVQLRFYPIPSDVN